LRFRLPHDFFARKCTHIRKLAVARNSYVPFERFPGKEEPAGGIASSSTDRQSVTSLANPPTDRQSVTSSLANPSTDSQSFNSQLIISLANSSTDRRLTGEKMAGRKVIPPPPPAARRSHGHGPRPLFLRAKHACLSCIFDCDAELFHISPIGRFGLQCSLTKYENQRGAQH
jgi:hypothetical protein